MKAASSTAERNRSRHYWLQDFCGAVRCDELKDVNVNVNAVQFR
jgi:hypothetical protein